MTLIFKCEFCGEEVKDAANIQTSNILHLAKDRTGNDRPNAGTMLPYGEYPDYCNSCYATLKDWLEGDVRAFLRDHFPLKKDDNAG